MGGGLGQGLGGRRQGWGGLGLPLQWSSAVSDEAVHTGLVWGCTELAAL